MEKYKKNIFVLILSSTIFFVLSSCGTMKVHVNKDNTYSRTNPITINRYSDDETGSLGELQFLLQSNGYRLMSYHAAKQALNFDSQRQSGTYHGEITNTTTVKSVYVLDFTYSYYYEMYLSYYKYSSFSASITDLRTGEIIMTATFRGKKGCRAVLKEFVNKMNTVIK
ncbi:MAG: hypothetical protein LBT27_04070 [Prevotellaceae bacterium]|jgi:hypothetical protein|nr:hypothetical protein [Prevotellaceae bacterium]